MLLIKNVKVVDGSGQPAFPADVLVNGDKISAIGDFPNKSADVVIEGLGAYLTPGFIDVNTDSDHYLTLFTNPAQQDFLLQGVTTIIGGHCGSSLAPLIYGSLESIRKWADINQVNVSWHTMEEFFTAVKKLSLSVNFGTLVGHSTIRRALIGEEVRDLTDKETKIFQQMIKESLEAGALGFSTGLGYTHSRQTSYKEIKTMLSVVAKYNAVYTTHLRDERDELFASVNETLNLFKETGVKTNISHLRPLFGFEKNFDIALNLIEKSSSRMDFTFDTYPFNTSVVPMYTFLPKWAQKGNLESMLEIISDPKQQKQLVKDMPKIKKGEVVIAQASGNELFVGRSPVDVKDLLQLMKVLNLRALLFYKNVDQKRLEELIFTNKALVASNSASLPNDTKTLKPERATRTFIRFLELAGQRKNYSFETAINKITQIPAKKFGIKNRGLVKEGYHADLAVILNNQIRYLIVNGQVVVRQGQAAPAAAGQIITR